MKTSDSYKQVNRRKNYPYQILIIIKLLCDNFCKILDLCTTNRPQWKECRLMANTENLRAHTQKTQNPENLTPNTHKNLTQKTILHGKQSLTQKTENFTQKTDIFTQKNKIKSKTEHTKPKKSMLKLCKKEQTNQKTLQLKQRKPHRRHTNLKENTENLSKNTQPKDEHKT